VCLFSAPLRIRAMASDTAARHTMELEEETP
jgi:hypothetical protein